MVNLTQLDFKRDPKEWGNALYTAMGQIVDEINTNIIPKMEDMLSEIQKVQNKINKLQKEKI